MAIRAALLDMDGTIYESGIDWLEIRRKTGLPNVGQPILRQLEALEASDPEKVARGREILLQAEADGAANGRLIPGAEELIGFLRARGVRCALITNNSRRSLDTFLAKHPLPFDLVLSRDDGAAKPDPGIFHVALSRLGVEPWEAIAIGDAHLDVIAAHRAGLAEIVLVASPSWMADHIPAEADYHTATDLIDARGKIAELLDA